MSTSEQRFAIIRVLTTGVLYLGGDDNWHDSESMAVRFHSLSDGKDELAKIFSRESVEERDRNYYAVIPLIKSQGNPVTELKSLPPPDFYEVGDPTKAEFIIEILSNDRFGLSFTPVDNITGAGQMQAGVSTDPHDDRAVARSAKFSFPGWMEQNEIVKLRESATRHGQWKNLRIVNRGNGFSKWFIVVLSQDLR